MPTVGEVLRTERERQGRTLKEISDALNIKRQYLATFTLCNLVFLVPLYFL